MTRCIVGAVVVWLSQAGSLCAQPAQTDLQTTARELRTRLEQFAHDSMQGRPTGSLGHAKATAFLVAELKRLGIPGAAAGGQYVQDVPILRRQLDLSRVRAWDNGPYVAGLDFIPITGGVFGLTTPDSADVRGSVYVAGGRIGAPDAIAPAKAAGKFVVFEPPRRSDGSSDYQLWSVRDALASYRDAAAIFIATLDLMPRSFLDELTKPRMQLRERVAVLPRTVPIIAVTRGVAQKSFESNARGPAYALRNLPFDAGTPNVVALIDGSDPVLRTEYVVLSAHADHLGIGDSSARAGDDSVFNGADESGTGSIALLAIAQRLATLPVKPKRSIILLWTVGAEQGLLGAEYFTDRPVVTRASIVANINVGAIGRGAAADVRIAGAGRLSTEFSGWIMQAAQRPEYGLVVTTDPARRSESFCDTDDWHFYRWGIPSLSISTGPNADSRRVTDEASRIDYAKYARVTQLIQALVEDVANRPAAPRVDRAKPDPRTACVQ